MTTHTPSSDLPGPPIATPASDLRRWELIADTLRADITAGRLAPGQREILEHREVEAAPWAKELRMSARSRVVVPTTRASVRGRPVGLSIGAYPLPRFEGLAERVAEFGSFTPALRALGVRDYTRAKSVVSARLPTALEADRLARSAGQPVLVVNSVDVDAEGTPIRSGITLFAADAVQLTVRPDEGGKA